MKNLLTWIVIILIILIGGYLLLTPSTPTEDGPIKIGFATPLSGDAGVWGINLRKGFDFALDEINQKGGINGRQIEVVYEDDKCDATTGVSVFNKLIDIDKTKIITGTVCSSVAMSVANKTQENGILYIATGATHPDVPDQGDLVFRLWVSDAYEAGVLSKYAMETLGAKTFGITHVNDNPAGLGVRDALEASIEKGGASIIGIEEYSSEERDFKTQLTKLISKKPEALYLFAMPEQTTVIIDQARTLGFTGPILLYGPSLLTQGIRDKITNKENLYYALPIDKKETNFWMTYEEKTGEEADTLIAAGYDNMKILEGGLKECGEDNNCIRDYILGLKEYHSTRGTFGFESNGDITGFEFEVKSLEEVSEE